MLQAPTTCSWTPGAPPGVAGPVAWSSCSPCSLPQALAPARPLPPPVLSSCSGQCARPSGVRRLQQLWDTAWSGAQGTGYPHGSEGLVRLLAAPRET